MIVNVRVHDPLCCWCTVLSGCHNITIKTAPADPRPAKGYIRGQRSVS